MKLSPEETAALCERNFFLYKDSATKKVIDLFGNLEKMLKKELSNNNFGINDLNISSGKIFRGENYRLYPYILLDYPRLFTKETVFAFRTMFWWGHEFSFTLHLQGKAFDQFRKVIYENFSLLAEKEVFYCVNDTPWQYYFEKNNYIPVEEMKDRREEILTSPFIKLSRKIPVQSYDRLSDYCLETFRLLIGNLEQKKQVTNR